MSINSEESTLNIRLTGDQARAEIKKLQEATAQFNRELKKLSDPAEIKVKRDQIEQAKADMAKLRSSIKENLTVIINGQVAGKSINDLRAALSLAKKEFRTMVDPTEMKAQAASINQIQRQIDHLESPLKKSQGAFTGLITEIKRMGAIAASAFGFQFLINKFEDLLVSNAKLSDSFANIRRVTGLTDEEVKKLNRSLQEIDTRTSTQGLRDLSVVAGKLGVKGVKDIAAFTQSLDMLVVSLGDELGNADEIATQLGKILNVFEGKITADELTHLGNAMVSLANNGVATGGFIADFTQRVSGIAKASNLSLGATVGLAAGFEELGLRSESSATALQKLLSTIAGDMPKAARIAGVDLKKFNDLFSNKPQEALILYAQGLVKNKQSFAEITASFKDAGEEGARVVQTLQAIGQRGEFLKEKIDLGNKSMKESSEIFSAFALKNDNLAASLEKTGKLIGKYFANSTLTDFFTSAVKALNFQLSNQDDKKSALKTSQEIILSNRHEIETIHSLLEEYDKLTTKGIAPTSAEKGRLHAISNKLNEITGASVGKLNAETGAYQVNTELVKKYAKEKQAANLSEAASILNIIRVQEQNLALVLANKKANEELTESHRAEIKKRAEAGLPSLANDAEFKESKRLYDQKIELNHRIANYAKSIEKSKADLKLLGYSPEAIDEAINQIRETNAKIENEKKNNNPEGNGDVAAGKMLREKNKELFDYYKNRLTTITTFTVQEQNYLRQQKSLFATNEQKEYANQLQSEIDFAKQNLDTVVAGTEDEKAAREAYRIAVNKLDAYWDSLEIDATKAKLNEIEVIRQNAEAERLVKELRAIDIQLDLAKKGSEAELEAKQAYLTKEYEIYANKVGKESSLAIAAKRRLNEQLNELDAEYAVTNINHIKNYLQTATELYSQLDSYLTLRENNETTHARNEAAKRKRILDDELAHGTISQSQYNDQLGKINEAANQKEAAARKQQFERNKQIQKAQVAINAAAAVVQAINDYGYVAGVIIGALIAGLALTQIDEIDKQEFPEYGTGGILDGPSHKDGGIAVVSKGKKVAELEGGELIGSRAFVQNNPDIAQLVIDSSKAGGAKIGVNSFDTPRVNIPVVNRKLNEVQSFGNGGQLHFIGKTLDKITHALGGTTEKDKIDVAKSQEGLLLECRDLLTKIDENTKAAGSKEVVFVQKKYDKFQQEIKLVKEQTQV